MWLSGPGWRTTWPAGTSPSTPWLSASRARAPRPVRRPGRPLRPPAPHAARPGGVLRRRSVADAPRRPVHRQARPGARPRTGGRRPRRTSPALDRLGRADQGRAGQDRDGAGALGGTVVRRPHGPGRGIPPRAARPGPRTGPDPPAQGRAGPHAGGRGQDQCRPDAAPGRALPRRGQAEDPGLRRRGGDLPPPRGGRGPYDPQADAGPPLPERRGGGGHRAGQPAPALPYLPAGVDGPCRAPLRPRRRPVARPPQRAHPLRLHHPERQQGQGTRPPDGRARGPHRRAPPTGGARRHPPGPRRVAGDGRTRSRTRARRGAGTRLPARATARRGASG